MKYSPDVAKAKDLVVSSLLSQSILSSSSMLSNEKVILLLVEHFKERQMFQEAKTLAKSSIEAGNSCSFSLWKEYISSEIIISMADATTNEKQIESLLTEAVCSLNKSSCSNSSNESSHELRVHFLQQLASSCSPFIPSLAKKMMLIDYSVPVLNWYLQYLLAKVNSSSSSPSVGKPEQETDCECLKQSTAMNQVRMHYLELAKDWRGLGAFWACCLEFEQRNYLLLDQCQSQCPAKMQSQKTIRDIWQKLSMHIAGVNISNCNNFTQQQIIDLWISHLQWLINDVGDWVEAAQLATKASQVFDSEGCYEFVITYHQLINPDEKTPIPNQMNPRDQQATRECACFICASTL